MAIEIVDFSMKNGGYFHSYVGLPEGMVPQIVTRICRWQQHGFVKIVPFLIFGCEYVERLLMNLPQGMGVSENSVPLNPMVLLIIIPIKWLFHWEYTLFSDKPVLMVAIC